MINIGLVEDDLKIGSLLKTALMENGYQTKLFNSSSDAFPFLTNQDYDLWILDIMMPGINGLSLCSNIRSANSKIPILMLTALGTVDDKVTGLQAGADDYLVKPFHLKELLARIEALLRRSKPAVNPQNDILSYADISLNTSSKEVHRAGILIALTAKEYILLELFLKNPNRLLSRQFIAEQAWEINFDTGTNVIDVYVNFLRKKIDKDFERKLIHTKINMGYILK